MVTVLPSSVPALPCAAAEAAPAASRLLLSCFQLSPSADTAINRMNVRRARMGVPLVVRFAMVPGFTRRISGLSQPGLAATGAQLLDSQRPDADERSIASSTF